METNNIAEEKECKQCKKSSSKPQRWIIFLAVYLLMSSLYGTI